MDEDIYQIFVGMQRSDYANRLRYTPKPALVIEISKAVVGPPYVLAAKRTPEDLEEWISTQIANDRDGFSRPGLRLIIGGARDAEPRSLVAPRHGPRPRGPPGPPRPPPGYRTGPPPGFRPGFRPGPPPPGMPPPTHLYFEPPDVPAPEEPTMPTDETTPEDETTPSRPPLEPNPPIPEGGDIDWPTDAQNLAVTRHRRIERSVPFSARTMERILSSFKLPSSTYWLCQSRDSYIKTHHMSGSNVGLAARYCYLRGLDIVLSLSHNPVTDITTILLIGPTVRQTEFLRLQITRLARFAHHPALLPTLMSANAGSVLTRRVDEYTLFTTMLESEWMRPRPGPAVMGVSVKAVENARNLAIADMEMDMLEAQLSGTADFVQMTSSPGPESKKGKEKARDDVVGIGLALGERLEFVAGMIAGPRLRARMYKERNQSILSAAINPVVTNAFYNLSTLRTFSIFREAHDKNTYRWLKAIVITVMAFIPGIFAAALFSTPFMTVADPPQWAFWLSFVPLTIGYLAVFTTWSSWKAPEWLGHWPDMARWMRRFKRKIRRRFGISDDTSSVSSGSATSLVDDDE